MTSKITRKQNLTTGPRKDETANGKQCSDESTLDARSSFVEVEEMDAGDENESRVKSREKRCERRGRMAKCN